MPTTVLSTVLFDLDGTLSDSAPGILSSLRQAFAVVGVSPMTAEQEAAILGPPFYESLPAIVGPDHVGAIIESYRGFYAAGGMYDAVAYDGIQFGSVEHFKQMIIAPGQRADVLGSVEI